MQQNEVVVDGRFGILVQGLDDMLSERVTSGGMTCEEVAAAIDSLWSGSGFNCYPGVPGHTCHEIAFFLGLHRHPGVAGRGHLKAEGAFRCFVQHMQGRCPTTQTAVVVIYNWDEEVWNDWVANVRLVAAYAQVEIYAWTASQLRRLPTP